MFKAYISEHNKIWGGTKNSLGRTAPNSPPCLRALAEPSPESLLLVVSCLCRGLDIL